MENRIYKFRAWDKKLKIMWNNIIIVDGKVARKTGFEQDDGLEIEILNNCAPMQYTGLKDKNGKEIYEGDILANREIHKDNFYCVVEFGAGGFRGCTIPGRNHNRFLYNMMNDEGAEYNEVIGNIYENPELLK